MSNKPKLRFKEFKEDWKSSTFCSVFKTIQNNNFSRDLLDGKDENCSKNVHYGDILIKYGAILDCNKITLPSINNEVDLKKFNQESYLKDGDILIADTAEDYTVGKACEIVNAKGKILSGLHTIPCRPQLEFAKKYLGYYINSYCYHDTLIPLITGIKVSSISKSSIAKTIVKYPCLEEQQKIAEFLSKVDAIIAEREEEVKGLEQQKKGLMQKIFSQQLRFTDSNNNPYPDWKEKSFNNYCINISSGKSKKRSDTGTYNLYGSTGIIGKIDIADYSGNYLLVARVGANAGYTYKINDKCGISDNTLVIDLKPNILIDYIYYYFRNWNLNRLVFGSGQPLVTGGMLKKITVKIPCLEEQEKIANLLSKMDELIEEKKSLLSDWQQFKKGLLQQMFV